MKRVVSFLDKSKTFDNVWHTKLRFKSEQNGIKRALLIFLKRRLKILQTKSSVKLALFFMN